MVTNHAGYSPRTEFGPFHIHSLLTTVNGGAALGTVGVCTVAGRLGMTLLSQQADATLLDAVKARLNAASQPSEIDAAQLTE